MTDPRTFGLTPRAKRLLDFLRERSAISEVSPSYREIAEALGFSSVATVHDVVVALEKRGFIRRIPNSSRSIELVEPLAFVLPREIARRVRADAAIRGRSPEEHVADAILAFSPSNATAQPRRGWRSSPGF